MSESDSSGAAKKAPVRKTAAKAPPKKATAKKISANQPAAKRAPAKKKAAKKSPATRLRASTKAASASVAKRAPSSKFFKNARTRAESILKNPEKLKRLTEETSAKTGNRNGPFAEVLDDLKTMIRLVSAYARGDYRDIPLDTLLLVVAALIYVVSPLDLIPDAIPVVGLTDDVAVVIWTVKRVRDELGEFRKWEEGRSA